MQGQTINGYTLQRRLGEGGMAEVWYAENEIGKPAAVKILNENLSRNTQIVERFHNEALVMVKLDHPNIRQVYGYGYLGNRHCIIMEYLDGDDLEALLKSGRHFSDEELQRWWNQTVDALNYTHAMGIVHRDIKPSNLFLDKRGNIKLLDFGIAKVKESMSMTRTGMTMGTLMYMSPEQVKDPKRVGTKSDVYSLAVSFVHLLSGKPIYDSETSSEFDIQLSIVSNPVDLSAVPSAWQGFLEPYLEKDPDKRPALRHFEEVESLSPASTPAMEAKTVVGGMASAVAQPDNTLSSGVTRIVTSSKEERNSGSSIRENETSTPSIEDKPKSKMGLWIGLGVAAVATLLIVLFMKPKEESKSNFSHFEQATEKQVETQEAKQRAEAEAKAAQKEDEAYYKCTTVETCDSYLKDYPQGRYVNEVKAKKAELEVKVGIGSANGHDYVDLGLPSGTLWATCNIGASKPEDYGNYYAWGETKPKTDYCWETYKFYVPDSFLGFTKYFFDSDVCGYDNPDNLLNLEREDDPATAWGSGWRMPTKAQWDELLMNTTNKWTTQNGVKGRLFTAKNGQILFLPAAGYQWSDDGLNELREAGTSGNYWSRSLDTNQCPDVAYSLQIGSTVCDMKGQWTRPAGKSVRPIRSK